MAAFRHLSLDTQGKASRPSFGPTIFTSAFHPFADCPTFDGEPNEAVAEARPALA